MGNACMHDEVGWFYFFFFIFFSRVGMGGKDEICHVSEDIVCGLLDSGVLLIAAARMQFHM